MFGVIYWLNRRPITKLSHNRPPMNCSFSIYNFYDWILYVYHQLIRKPMTSSSVVSVSHRVAVFDKWSFFYYMFGVFVQMFLLDLFPLFVSTYTVLTSTNFSRGTILFFFNYLSSPVCTVHSSVQNSTYRYQIW